MPKREPGRPMKLLVLCQEGERKVFSDVLKLQPKWDKHLEKLNLAGFGSTQIQQLKKDLKTEWRHLGLAYSASVEEIK